MPSSIGKPRAHGYARTRTRELRLPLVAEKTPNRTAAENGLAWSRALRRALLFGGFGCALGGVLSTALSWRISLRLIQRLICRSVVWPVMLATFLYAREAL